MPMTRGKRPRLARTQRAKKIRPSAPLLETRARSILSEMVTEMAAEPMDDALRLPEPPKPILVDEESLGGEAHSLDDMPADDLAEIARQGASLELDGSKHDAADLVSLAKNVKDDAHLKITNSGTFTADELAMIARSGGGQVILA